MNSRDLAAQLPDIATLRERCRALAMVEAIMSPTWEYRYYSFNNAWAVDEQMASMRNGSGDAYSIVFAPHGAFIRGFDHESPMSPAAASGELWPGLVDTVPAVFLPQANEPAFSYEGKLDATLCLWRQPDDASWQTGPVDYPVHSDGRVSPDGSELLTILCDASTTTYLDFAADYYERTLDPAAVAHVWALRPLTTEVVTALNPDVTLSDLDPDRDEIGYPA